MIFPALRICSSFASERTPSMPLSCKVESCAQKCTQFFFFKNKLYNNYSCGGLHELNMSCVSKWDVMEVNDKRQPVIEAVATRASWTNPRLGHVTGGPPMVEGSFSPQSRGSWENWFLIWAVFDSFGNQKLKLTNLRPVITKEQIKVHHRGSAEDGENKLRLVSALDFVVCLLPNKASTKMKQKQGKKTFLFFFYFGW